MSESLLKRIKSKLKEIFTKLIRGCQKIINKLPDGPMKVAILQALAKAKSKLNDVNKMTVENGEKMSKELENDAKNIEETIKRTMDKLDKKDNIAQGKFMDAPDGINPVSLVRNAKAGHTQKKADKFAKKHNIADSDREFSWGNSFWDDIDEDFDEFDDFFN